MHLEQKKTLKYRAAEKDFIKIFFTHPNWIYEAVTFKLGKIKYTPDFYDANRNTFIEVIGTKQAFSEVMGTKKPVFAGNQKYKLLNKLYPKIKFEFRLSNGELLTTKEDKNEDT